MYFFFLKFVLLGKLQHYYIDVNIVALYDVILENDEVSMAP